VDCRLATNCQLLTSEHVVRSTTCVANKFPSSWQQQLAISFQSELSCRTSCEPGFATLQLRFPNSATSAELFTSFTNRKWEETASPRIYHISGVELNVNINKIATKFLSYYIVIVGLGNDSLE
jgi:hypothetical protein